MTTGRRLTVRMVETAAYEGANRSRCVLWDGGTEGVPGFGLRTYPSGRKAWLLSYWAGGRKRQMALGDWPALSLDAARKKAGRLRSEARDGGDPLEDRQRAALGETVADLAKTFLDEHGAKLRPRTLDEYERQLDTHILPRWGARQAKTITRGEVAQLHRKIGEAAPIQANRVLALLSKFFAFAAVRGFLEKGAENPARGLERYPERKRDRWVRPEELPRLAEAIDAEPDLFVRAYLWLALLIGTRKRELLTLRWKAVDLERGELRLSDAETKSGRALTVPLSAPARAILTDLPRLEGNPHVFPGAKEKAARVNIDKAWRRVRDRATLSLWREHPKAAPIIAGLEAALRDGSGKLTRHPTCDEVRERADFELPTGLGDVWMHDLRRSVGSWLASFEGASLPLIGRVLNHSSTQTTAIYARLSEDPARAALEGHGQRLMEAAKGLRVVR